MKNLNNYIIEAWSGVKKQSIKAEIEAWCEEMGIKNYTINSKGEIDVNGNIDLADKDFKELWRVGINGQPLGGLLVDNDLVLVVTDTGDVQYMNPADGTTRHETPLIQAPLSGNVAVSGLYLDERWWRTKPYRKFVLAAPCSRPGGRG